MASSQNPMFVRKRDKHDELMGVFDFIFNIIYLSLIISLGYFHIFIFSYFDNFIFSLIQFQSTNVWKCKHAVGLLQRLSRIKKPLFSSLNTMKLIPRYFVFQVSNRIKFCYSLFWLLKNLKQRSRTYWFCKVLLSTFIPYQEKTVI